MTNRLSVVIVNLTLDRCDVDVVSLVDDSLTLQRVASIPIDSVRVQHKLYLNTLYAHTQLQDELLAFYDSLEPGQQPASIGFTGPHGVLALLDKRGKLLGLPELLCVDCYEYPHYIEHKLPSKYVGKIMGLPASSMPSVFEQMVEMADVDDPRLAIARFLVDLSGLFVNWTTGNAMIDHTSASTTYCYSAKSRSWAMDLFEDLEVPTVLTPSILHAGTMLGRYNESKVITIAGNRVASAVTVAPAAGDANYAYLVLEDRSYMGIEIPEPIALKRLSRKGLSMHAGAYGSTLLTNEMAGLYLLKRCAQSLGEEYTVDYLIGQAEKAAPFQAFISPNTPMLHLYGDFQTLYSRASQELGQPTLEDPGAVARTLLEGLAFSYADALQTLQSIEDEPITEIRLVSDGAQYPLLCQMIADATGLPVVAGPVDAASLGGAAVQLNTLGVLNLDEFHDLLSSSMPFETYEPQNHDEWVAALG